MEQVLEKLDSIGKASVRPLLGLKHSTMLEDDLWGAKTRATIYGTDRSRAISTNSGSQLLENAKTSTYR